MMQLITVQQQVPFMEVAIFKIHEFGKPFIHIYIHLSIHFHSSISHTLLLHLDPINQLSRTVMEDLRVLEQQQRDSQRLLSSIKLTKQHKLQQRSSLETKLSSLKYSNGESRAQLLHAREILSKSTRELASAKLRSERSGANLKKFDEKLQKTLAIVRGLHGKRRKLDHAIARLENMYRSMEDEERRMMQDNRRVEVEVDDAKHREALLMKSIQGSKLKVQEYVEDTLRLRSELSALEVELTSVQQLEASTKFRAESARDEIEREDKRHEEFVLDHGVKMAKVKETKEELQQKIEALRSSLEEKDAALKSAWEVCVKIQKEEGLPVSTSPDDANLDMDAIRSSLERDVMTSLQLKAEEADASAKLKELQEKLSSIKLEHESVISNHDALVAQVEEEQKAEEERVKERDAVLSEYKAEKARVEELRKVALTLKEENEAYEMDLERKKEEMDTMLASEKEKLAALTARNQQLDEQYATEKEEIDRETMLYREEVEEAKKRTDEAKAVLDEVQKRGDDNTKAASKEAEEFREFEREQDELLEKLRSEQMDILKG